jgi:hypothetical protein
MPIYEPDMTPEDMDKAMNGFVCAECGGNLTRCWGGYYGHNCWMLRCSQDHTHEGLKPKGKNMEGVYINASLRGGLLPMETTALQTLSKPQMLERINKVRFPRDLTPTEKDMMANVALEYGFDPFFHEIMIYQGQPYVGIAGLERKAQETGKLEAIQGRPATQDERSAYGCAEDDYLWEVELWTIGATRPFISWGYVSADEIQAARNQAKAKGHKEDALPIVKDPNMMAHKRGRVAVIREAFSIPLPDGVKIVEAEFTVLEDEETPPKKKTAPAKAKPQAPPTKSANQATEAQLREINRLAEAKGYGDLVIAALLKTEFNVESTADLSVPQASKVIDMMKEGKGLQTKMPVEE